jgi:hypothetical protein
MPDMGNIICVKYWSCYVKFGCHCNLLYAIAIGNG